MSQEIPEMGGRRIGGFLRDWAKHAPVKTQIVELGTWLGAGTSQMATGLQSRADDHNIRIHTFDSFTMSASSAEKARKQGVEFKEGDDTLPWVREALKPYGPLVEFHKGMLDEQTMWTGEPISLYVDDATKYPYTFYLCLKKFGPSWIPGKTIVVLMDALIYLKKRDLPAKNIADLRIQHDFITERPDSFTEVEGFKDTSVAAYRYEGGVDFGALKMPLSPNQRRELKTSRIWA
ncbi:hypothetical protein [Sinorhizobium meliloti]|uniref:hypothetical protein n=1 Tax=Rhizobium meliloti TaxID=382 RepID=UPI000B49AABD|nr:hypothetical protein [Sinorhizobium meliloti]ASP64368.1 hypothetical protein CDO29_07075 [Sinorhizobium meliloti]MQX02810.1 hypothetical protein [Sinorhizobium meliloti]RVK52068.1 hypothetical protein CN160_09130 [Sinorhizobium meliloti]